MAKLVGTINRWVGISKEVKPYVGMVDLATRATLTENDVPIGSIFYEEDTGWEYSYRGGYIWELSPDAGRTKLIIAKLDELLSVQKESLTEIQRQNGHLTIGSDLEGKEALEMAIG